MPTPAEWMDPEYRARLNAAANPLASPACRYCKHDRDEHGRWPSMPGAEDWACWACGCEEFQW